MKMTRFRSLALVAVASLALMGCSKQTQEQKVLAQIKDNQHALNAEERQLAQVNAEQYFNKEFPVAKTDGTLGRARGAFLECRPSDSNANGMVTCRGKVPADGGGFQDQTRYCGYRPELVGCSDVDMVKR